MDAELSLVPHMFNVGFDLYISVAVSPRGEPEPERTSVIAEPEPRLESKPRSEPESGNEASIVISSDISYCPLSCEQRQQFLHLLFLLLLYLLQSFRGE